MKVSLAERALGQIDEIASFYFSVRPSLKNEFLEELDATLILLRANPRIGVIVSRHHRKLLLRKFPYSVIYEIEEENDRIVISAVGHQRRRSGSWYNRVEEFVPAYIVDQLAA